MPGFFITFEGGEGSGKTTQLKALLNHLAAIGREAVETRDPGGTTIGNQIRAVVLDGENDKMDPLTELFLYEASRRQLVREVIRPALAAGRIVVCDRFTDSTIAYQGYGRSLDLQFLRHLNEMATGGIRPDLTLLLDIEPTLGLARISGRLREPRPKLDRLEEEILDFHLAVRKGYLAQAEAEPDRIVVLDATQGIFDLEAAIRRRVESRLPGQIAAGR
jgi:dTMP kinase